MGEAGEQFDFLTHQALEGEILANRLLRGSLPVHESVRYAIEIGGVLHSAHLRNLYHGSISPACIALTDAGPRLLRPPNPPIAAGVSGDVPDSLEDVFAFGALLYEMLTGRQPFGGNGDGPGQAILESTPVWSGPGFSVPEVLRPVIASLTASDPLRRRQRIQSAVLELRLAAMVLSRPTPRHSQHQKTLAPRAATPPRRLLNRRFAAAAVALLALAGSAVAAVLLLEKKPTTPVFKFTITEPEQTTYLGTPAISPDGRQIAFSAMGAEGKRMLWLRSLDTLHVAPIPGTEGGAEPFWSPDGHSIGFFADASLKRVGIGDGTPATICSVEGSAGGGAWNSDGVIVFAPGLATGLYRVAAAGGVPQQLLSLDSRKQEHAFLWPAFLPDGRHFLFFDRTGTFENTGVYVASIEGAEHGMVLRSDTNAVYADIGENSRGDLLFINEGRLAAQAFDLSRLMLKGEPATVANDVGAFTSLSLIPVSASNNGVLAYQSSGKQTRQLVWVDRNGVQLGVAAPGDYGAPRLSPDGSRIAVEKSANDASAEVWILTETDAVHLADPASGTPNSPVWSPDGSAVLFGDGREGASNLYTMNPESTGSVATLVFESAVAKRPTDWSGNGRYILFTSQGQTAERHVWALSVAARQVRQVGFSGRNDEDATFSADGKWIAYQSDESGSAEIYVQPFDGLWGGADGRRIVSTGGGGAPRWSRDGDQLYYVTSAGDLMSVDVKATGPNLEFAPPRTLFRTRHVANRWNSFDVSPDGQRFIMSLPLEDSTSSPITILANWTNKSKR